MSGSIFESIRNSIIGPKVKKLGLAELHENMKVELINPYMGRYLDINFAYATDVEDFGWEDNDAIGIDMKLNYKEFVKYNTRIFNEGISRYEYSSNKCFLTIEEIIKSGDRNFIVLTKVVKGKKLKQISEIKTDEKGRIFIFVDDYNIAVLRQKKYFFYPHEEKPQGGARKTRAKGRRFRATKTKRRR